MKVAIDDLKAQLQQKLSTDFNETLSGLEAVKPVVGELHISYTGSGLLLSGRVKTLLKLQCDRCLRPYFQALTVDIDEKFVSADYLPDERETTKERELHDRDFVEPLPASGVLDISDVVYQAVTLATPSFRDCGAECPGPPVVQEAAAGDPRWKNLKTLFPNDDSQPKS